MMDCYAHLEAGAIDPLAGLRIRMATAGVDAVLAVETWKGETRDVLESVSPKDRDIRIALCYRGESQAELQPVLDNPALRCVRVKTADLEEYEPWLGAVADSGKWVLPHAEHGIGRLTNALAQVAKEIPGLRIYVPHLCWPARDGQDDPDWPETVETLSAMRGVIAGVSGMAYFSREDFPHDDLRRTVEPLLAAFGPGRLVSATDYPLFDRSLYGAYITLACQWIRSVWPDWKEPDALFT